MMGAERGQQPQRQPQRHTAPVGARHLVHCGRDDLGLRRRIEQHDELCLAVVERETVGDAMKRMVGRLLG